MNPRSPMWAEVDQQGRLVLPAEVSERYGIRPGSRMRVDLGVNDLRLHRPASHLAKIYIEPTNRCNLTCRTCIRNTWDEPLGKMSEAAFIRILDSLRALSPLPTVFFGGLGEPLFHPKMIEMVRQVKSLGGRVELITNGILLDENRARQLISAGLDMLWVSIDGATPESYADVRLGDELRGVIANLTRLRELRPGGHHPRPQVGIAFVAMKRNINDLPAVIRLGKQVGATHFMVSNVFPYTAELLAERLYERSLQDITYLQSEWLPQLRLPKMDLNLETYAAFFQALNSGCNVTFAGSPLSGANDVCTFIESGAMAVGWNGEVTPCLALLHNHTSYLHGKLRASHRHVIGSVLERDLLELWNDPEYLAYRELVHSFGFAPCTFCGGCDLSEANREDCLGNTFPTCGGCLWAQGVIQCP